PTVVLAVVIAILPSRRGAQAAVVGGTARSAVMLTGMVTVRARGWVSSTTRTGPRMVGTVPSTCVNGPGCGAIAAVANPGDRGRTPSRYRATMLAGAAAQAWFQSRFGLYLAAQASSVIVDPTSSMPFQLRSFVAVRSAT